MKTTTPTFVAWARRAANLLDIGVFIMPNHLTQHKPHASDCDCEACLTEWGDNFEAVLLLDRLAARDPERHGAKPASDREWREYLDREFPRVRDINGHVLVKKSDGHKHNPDRECPTCDWALQVCRDCGTYEAGLDQPCPMTAKGVA